MPLFLLLETSSDICSVALSENEKILALREDKNKEHVSLITVFIDEVLKSQSKNISDLSAIAVSAGPGSYTGLRVGISAARGLALAGNLPILAISSLLALASGADFLSDKTLLCPVINSRKGEVFFALFDSQLRELIPASPAPDDEAFFERLPLQHNISIFAGASEKLLKKNHPNNFCFIPNILPSATLLAGLAYKKFMRGDYNKSGGIEPIYVKEFYSGSAIKTI